MQVYKIDADGYFVAEIILNHEDDLHGDVIWIKPPQGLYKAKWTGNEWVEGATQEYIDSVKNVVAEPSDMDILKEQVESQNQAIAELTLLLFGGM